MSMFIVGLAIGALLGIFSMGLLAISGDDERELERTIWLKNVNNPKSFIKYVAVQRRGDKWLVVGMDENGIDYVLKDCKSKSEAVREMRKITGR